MRASPQEPSLSLARLIPRRSVPTLVEPPVAAPAPSSLGADVERLISQLEDDMRFTMNVIAREAEQARARIDESVEQSHRIHDASDSLMAVTVRAKTVNNALTLSAERLDATAHTIRGQVEGVDSLSEEARKLTGQVGESMAMLGASVSRIDTVAHLIATIARQTKILALNAGIEAARAGPEGRGFGVVAQEINALAAKAQSATADIARHVDELHAVASASESAAHSIASLVGRIGPVVQSVRIAIDQQLEEAAKTAARAVDTASFIDTVAARATEVKTLADDSGRASKAAKQAGDGVVLAMSRYTQRSTVYLRNSVSGDRREFERVPVKIPCAIIRGDERRTATALDISEGGALLVVDGEVKASEDRVLLSMVSIGDCVGEVVGVSELGAHFRFYRPSEAIRRRIREVIDATKEADEPFVKAVKTGAAEIQRAFEDGIATGEVTLDALITTDYRPIPGTDPTQYNTDATHFYERVLPSLLQPYWDWKPSPVFALATDRNAFLPVHQARFSLPQRPGDWAWNDIHSRNKRIMERWQSLVMSRNRDPEFRKVFLRHMDSGKMTPTKVFASPVWVQGRLWGNLAMAFYY